MLSAKVSLESEAESLSSLESRSSVDSREQGSRKRVKLKKGSDSSNLLRIASEAPFSGWTERESLIIDTGYPRPYDHRKPLSPEEDDPLPVQQEFSRGSSLSLTSSAEKLVNNAWTRHYVIMKGCLERFTADAKGALKPLSSFQHLNHADTGTSGALKKHDVEGYDLVSGPTEPMHHLSSDDDADLQPVAQRRYNQSLLLEQATHSARGAVGGRYKDATGDTQIGVAQLYRLGRKEKQGSSPQNWNPFHPCEDTLTQRCSNLSAPPGGTNEEPQGVLVAAIVRKLDIKWKKWIGQLEAHLDTVLQHIHTSVKKAAEQYSAMDKRYRELDRKYAAQCDAMEDLDHQIQEARKETLNQKLTPMNWHNTPKDNGNTLFSMQGGIQSPYSSNEFHSEQTTVPNHYNVTHSRIALETKNEEIEALKQEISVLRGHIQDYSNGMCDERNFFPLTLATKDASLKHVDTDPSSSSESAQRMPSSTGRGVQTVLLDEEWCSTTSRTRSASSDQTKDAEVLGMPSMRILRIEFTEHMKKQLGHCVMRHPRNICRGMHKRLWMECFNLWLASWKEPCLLPDASEDVQSVRRTETSDVGIQTVHVASQTPDNVAEEIAYWKNEARHAEELQEKMAQVANQQLTYFEADIGELMAFIVRQLKYGAGNRTDRSVGNMSLVESGGSATYRADAPYMIVPESLVDALSPPSAKIVRRALSTAFRKETGVQERSEETTLKPLATTRHKRNYRLPNYTAATTTQGASGPDALRNPPLLQSLASSNRFKSPTSVSRAPSRESQFSVPSVRSRVSSSGQDAYQDIARKLAGWFRGGETPGSGRAVRLSTHLRRASLRRSRDKQRITPPGLLRDYNVFLR